MYFETLSLINFVCSFQTCAIFCLRHCSVYGTSPSCRSQTFPRNVALHLHNNVGTRTQDETRSGGETRIRKIFAEDLGRDGAGRQSGSIVEVGSRFRQLLQEDQVQGNGGHRQRRNSQVLKTV